LATGITCEGVKEETRFRRISPKKKKEVEDTGGAGGNDRGNGPNKKIQAKRTPRTKRPQRPAPRDSLARNHEDVNSSWKVSGNGQTKKIQEEKKKNGKKLADAARQIKLWASANRRTQKRKEEGDQKKKKENHTAKDHSQKKGEKINLQTGRETGRKMGNRG